MTGRRGPQSLATGYVQPRILAVLQDANGQYVKTRKIIDHVWTMHDLDGPIDAITAVAKAAKNLRQLGYEIDAIRGHGYRIPVDKNGALLAVEEA